MAKRCYYETLAIDRTASDGEIKAAFRKYAMQYHPDRNPGDKTSEHRFKEINEAYEVLKDPDKRAAYDRFGHAAFEHGMGGGAGFGADFSTTFSDLFEGIFGMAGGRGRSSGRERGADLRYNMEITLQEAFIGKNAQIRIPTPVTCEACSGSGAKAGTKPKTCPMCGGHGRVRHAVRVVQRLRPRVPRTHARGEHSGRRRGRHPHPACRRGRGRRARRSGGRSLHFSLDRRASVLSARRRRSALPRSRVDGDGGGRRRIPSTDHRRWQDQGESAGRYAIRPALPPRRQGNAGAALAPERRHVCPGGG